MKPKVFIGSSTEGLEIAYIVQESIQYSAESTVWTQGIFGLSKSTLTSLIEALKNFEFAIFVFTLDDVTQLRNVEIRTPRDNVIFELGLFMGYLGPNKTYFIVPNDITEINLPSDLLGIEPARYEATRSDGNLNAALGPACHKISQTISKNFLFKYATENIDNFNNLEERIKRILLNKLNNVSVPSHLQLSNPLSNESISNLSELCEILKIPTESLTMARYLFVKILIEERGEQASPIESHRMKNQLSGLEKKIESWERDTDL